MRTIGVFTYDFFPIIGGQGKHTYELYKQNQKDKQIRLLFFSPNQNNLHNHISLFPFAKKNPLKHLYFSLQLNIFLPIIIKVYHLDGIHLHAGPGGIFLLTKQSVPTIVTAHHTYWQQQKFIRTQKWKYMFYGLEKKTYEVADKVICVSSDTQKTINTMYHIPQEKLSCIPNGVTPISSYTQPKSQSDNMLYVGRIDKRKGVDFLLDAMKLVQQYNPKITLHVVGEGGERVALEEKTKKNNLPVKFYGYMNESGLQNMYKNIFLQVVPSIFEGFGISVLEAMANHTAVIATDTDGIRGIIKNNITGKLVQYGNVYELAENILELHKNISLRNRLVQNASQELSNFFWPNIYSQTIDIYDKLI